MYMCKCGFGVFFSSSQYVEHQREKWSKLVQADVHYQHVLLGKTLAAWKVGGNVLSFEGLVCVCLSEELPCCF